MGETTHAEVVTLCRRDPREEGEWETGCFYAESNNVALCASSDSKTHAQMQSLFGKADAHLRALCIKSPIDPEELRQVAFKFLLEHGGIILQSLTDTLRRQDVDIKNLAPNEARDWFCWLYREFRSWAVEKQTYG